MRLDWTPTPDCRLQSPLLDTHPNLGELPKVPSSSRPAQSLGSVQQSPIPMTMQTINGIPRRCRIDLYTPSAPPAKPTSSGNLSGSKATHSNTPHQKSPCPKVAAPGSSSAQKALSTSRTSARIGAVSSKSRLQPSQISPSGKKSASRTAMKCRSAIVWKTGRPARLARSTDKSLVV